MADEYYIRSIDDEEARGPFTVDDLQSLAEATKIDKETLIYDEEKQVWIEIGKWEEVCKSVFPERQKLTLRLRDQPKQTTGEAEDEEEDDAGDEDQSDRK